MARELVVFCGNKEGFENGLSQNRMCFVVMRKNMRLGGRDAVYFVVMRKNMRLGGRDAVYFVVMRKNMRLGGRDAVYFVVMRKNMRLGGREPDVLCGDEKEYEIGWPRTGGT